MIRYEIICNQVSTLSVRMLQKRNYLFCFTCEDSYREYESTDAAKLSVK